MVLKCKGGLGRAEKNFLQVVGSIDMMLVLVTDIAEIVIVVLT